MLNRVSPIILLFSATLGWSAENVGGVGPAGPTGKGMKPSAGYVSSVRDFARISYPQTQTPQTGSAPTSTTRLRSQTLLLTEPRQFDNEGVYIWRDAQGVWNVRRVSPKPLSLSGAVRTSVSLVTTGTQANALQVSGRNTGVIDQSGVPLKDAPPLQFKVMGDYVDFDLLANGRRDPSRIRLGPRGMTPDAIPFRLENRPLVSPGRAAEEGRQGAESPLRARPQGGEPGGTSQTQPSTSGSGGAGGGRGMLEQ
jgi:hypothetical protein